MSDYQYRKNELCTIDVDAFDCVLVGHGTPQTLCEVLAASPWRLRTSLGLLLALRQWRTEMDAQGSAEEQDA